MSLREMLVEHYVTPQLASELLSQRLITVDGVVPTTLDRPMALGEIVECDWPHVGKRVWPVTAHYAG